MVASKLYSATAKALVADVVSRKLDVESPIIVSAAEACAFRRGHTGLAQSSRLLHASSPDDLAVYRVTDTAVRVIIDR